MQKAIPLHAAVAEPDLDATAQEHASEQQASQDRHEFGGLLLVGLFKLSKSLGCILIGAICLDLIHHDLGSITMKMTEWFGMDPEGHLASALLDKADLINGHDLRMTSAFSFLGGALYAVEGTGLILHKIWAEYFTVVMTGLGLPWEIYEMVRRFTVWKAGLFAANLLVLGYLIWILRRKHKREHPRVAASN